VKGQQVIGKLGRQLGRKREHDRTPGDREGAPNNPQIQGGLSIFSSTAEESRKKDAEDRNEL
jgi:hypothetical protein